MVAVTLTIGRQRPSDPWNSGCVAFESRHCIGLADCSRTGALLHLAAALFLKETGWDATHIACKGSAPKIGHPEFENRNPILAGTACSRQRLGAGACMGAESNGCSFGPSRTPATGAWPHRAGAAFCARVRMQPIAAAPFSGPPRSTCSKTLRVRPSSGPGITACNSSVVSTLPS